MFISSAWISNQMSFLTSPLGVVIFIVFYSFWVGLLLPSSWTSIAAGFIYGTVIGSLIVIFSASLGAFLTFNLSRYFLRSWSKQRLNNFPKLNLIEKAVSQEGLKLVVLTRLSPAFPFGVLNLFYGLSSINLKEFSIGLLGIIPGSILYCSLGAFGGELTNVDKIIESQSFIQSYASTLIGFIATFGVCLLVIRAARKAIKEFESMV